MAGGRLHFAYGSNMDRAAMARRCPGAVPLGPARLFGYRYRINQDGYATVVTCAGGAVHGVLWRLGARDLAALDVYEAIAEGLYTKTVVPVRHENTIRKALTYVAVRSLEGRPRPLYQEAVVAAAREWNLPAPYVHELERWLPPASRLSHGARP